MSSQRLHRLSISATRELPDGIAISLEIPEPLKALFGYTPGQYITVEAIIDGQPVRRSYSICSYHKDNTIEIGVKRIDSGVFSTYALTLKAGDELNVMPPEGRFTTVIDDRNKHHYLLVAAGSGITPCLSIAKSVLQDETQSRVTLLYGNRTVASMMFKNDLAELKDTYTDRFNIINMLSAERQDVERFNGRITAGGITNMAQAGLLRVGDFHSAYLCGPLEMVQLVSGALNTLGMDQSQVHQELFHTGVAPNTAKQPNASTHETGDARKVTIMLDGAETDISVDPDNETILSAAQQAGIDMPFSCAGGMCCTCRCKIVEGSTSMDANFSLADWEVKAGYTLACQARPTSDVLILDFDAT